MARYIDADALKQRLLVGSELDPEPCKGFRSALLAMVDSQEDADVVEVVRCRDCKKHDWCSIEDLALNDETFFCKWGERRDDG